MLDEMVDVFNENYEKVGVAKRSEAILNGLWVHSFHCWFFRTEDGGVVQFQKRGAGKYLFANLWDISVAGHYLTGESLENGVREIKEEIGIDVSFSSLIPLGIKIDVAKLDNVINRQFCNVFLHKTELLPSDYAIDSNEVHGMVEISIQDGIDLFSGRKKFVNGRGMEYSETNDSWNIVDLQFTTNDFVPRVDSYYLKIFQLSKRCINGESDLAI